MLDFWKKRRALLRQLAEIERAREDHLLKIKDALPEEVQLLNVALFQYNDRKHHCEMELEVQDADYLLHKAKRLGVEGSPQQKIYDPKFTGVEPRPYFTPENKARMRKIIADARFAYWKQWAELLVPILSLIVAILALLRP
jgi:hypothetical protein